MVTAILFLTLIILAMIGGIAVSRWLYRHGAFTRPTNIEYW